MATVTIRSPGIPTTLNIYDAGHCILVMTPPEWWKARVEPDTSEWAILALARRMAFRCAARIDFNKMIKMKMFAPDDSENAKHGGYVHIVNYTHQSERDRTKKQ